MHIPDSLHGSATVTLIELFKVLPNLLSSTTVNVQVFQLLICSSKSLEKVSIEEAFSATLPWEGLAGAVSPGGPPLAPTNRQKKEKAKVLKGMAMNRVRT